MDLNWYAVYVRSRHEFKVAQRLGNLGIESFVAYVEKLSQWKDRKKLVQFPLFPCYIFVHMDTNIQSRFTVLKTTGVVKFAEMVTGIPEPIPERQINSLKTLVENKANLDPYPYLKEGHLVRIKKGALKGVEGILVSKPDLHMLILSIDLLQKGVSLRINATDVEPC